jgi:hypothetical protein
MNFFDPETTYMVCGPDELMTIVTEKGLADLFREHGPERLFVYVQLWDGSPEELVKTTTMSGADDVAKYYMTHLTSPRTSMVAAIVWDV